MGNSASSEVKKEDENGEEKHDNDWFGQCCASRKPANRDVVSEGRCGRIWSARYFQTYT